MFHAAMPGRLDASDIIAVYDGHSVTLPDGSPGLCLLVQVNPAVPVQTPITHLFVTNGALPRLVPVVSVPITTDPPVTEPGAPSGEPVIPRTPRGRPRKEAE